MDAYLSVWQLRFALLVFKRFLQIGSEKKVQTLGFLILCFGLTPPSWAMREGLDKVTWSTEHFQITTARKKTQILPFIGRLAETCYRRESEFFAFTLDHKVQIILKDEDDVANGYAYPADQWIVLYLRGADFELRGLTPWLPNVLAHELGHIFTLRKMGETSRFFGFSVFAKAAHPKGHAGVVQFDIPFYDSPPWLAEGLAQYASYHCGYDTLDAHREMVLRLGARDKALLSLNEMEAFVWDARGNEQVYDQGFALVDFLYRHYGRDTLNLFLEKCSTTGYRHAAQLVFQIEMEKLYQNWVQELTLRSETEINLAQQAMPLSAIPLLPEVKGYHNERDLRALPHGQFVFLSSQSNEYGRTDLWLGTQNHWHRLEQDVADVDVNPQGDKLAYLKNEWRWSEGLYIGNAYEKNLTTGKKTQLTIDGHIRALAYTLKGELFGIREEAGKTQLVNLHKGKQALYPQLLDSLEIRGIAAGVDSDQLLLTTTVARGGDISQLNLTTGEITPLMQSPYDERTPRYIGDTLYFAADYSGTFNIYSEYQGQLRQITQVAGGAFEPNTYQGRLAISEYEKGGYRLATLPWPIDKNGENNSVENEKVSVRAFPPPDTATYLKSKRDKTHSQLLGYFFGLGYQYEPSYELRLHDQDGNDLHQHRRIAARSTLPLDATTLWQNPSGFTESQFSVGLDIPLPPERSVPQFREMQAFNVWHYWVPDLFLGVLSQRSIARFDASTVPGTPVNAEGETRTSSTTLSMLMSGLSWNWSTHLAQGVQLGLLLLVGEPPDLDSANTQIGAAATLGNLFVRADLEPGEHGILSGNQEQLSTQIIPLPGNTIFLGQAFVEGYSHFNRLTFVSAGAQGEMQSGAGEMQGQYAVTCALRGFIPWRHRFVGGTGHDLTGLGFIPALQGYLGRYENLSISSFASQGSGINPLLLNSQSLSLRPNYSQANTLAQAIAATPGGEPDRFSGNFYGITTSLDFQILGLFSTEQFWRLAMTLPLDREQIEPWFTLQIGL